MIKCSNKVVTQKRDVILSDTQKNIQNIYFYESEGSSVE